MTINKQREIMRYWNAFYDRIDNWIGKDTIDRMYHDCSNEHNAISNRWDTLRTEIVRERISSTHTWATDKDHWSSKLGGGGNGYTIPFECIRCSLYANKYDVIGLDYIETNIPSRDGHGHFINMTCDEVFAIREKARKRRKGGRCLSCNVYDCIMDVR